MSQLDSEFWNERYHSNKTGWDIGHISTPIKEYVDQLTNKRLNILIPGCGNAHEAAYLFEQGFTKVHLLDWAEAPLEDFAKRFPDFPKQQLIQEDFFKHQGNYDLIFEQTFFCAIDPSMRAAYAKQMHKLLRAGGRLVGLLFDAPMYEDRPPYGGTKEEYKTYFSNLFTFTVFDDCHNSIPPRAGNELFINLKKI